MFGTLILAEDSRRSLHQRRDAATSRVASSHRLLAHELLLLQCGLEAIVQRSVSAIEHRQPFQERIVDRTELRRRPALNLKRAGERERHACRDRDSGAAAGHDLKQID